jgi:hypothetical chaperone protein
MVIGEVSVVSKAIGIDFGTSNSTVGFSANGKPQLIALENGKVTIPSAVFYCTERRKTYFGREAIAAYVDHYEGRLLRALKSILGSSLIDDSTQIGGKRQSFKAVISEFLRHLKQAAEHHLGQATDSVVLGRPVRFVDGDDAADAAAQDQLESAARSCGFKHIQFQYEPIAAALDYEQSVTREELALIVDIGGGTSDFSIVRVSPSRKGAVDRKQDVLANTGVHIGGTDLDRRLSVDQVMPLLGYGTPLRDKREIDVPTGPFQDLATWHKIAFLYNNKTLMRLQELQSIAARPELVSRLVKVVADRQGHRLAGNVEAAKMNLSENTQISVNLDYIEQGLGAELQRKRFEADIAPEKEKIIREIKECLVQAKVKAAQINTLFMTGGTTAVPAIFDACRKAVSGARLVEGDKMGSVGTGLAIDAAVKFGGTMTKPER